MGTGCSTATNVVTADAAKLSSVDNNENIAVIKDTYVEHHGETSHLAESQNGPMEGEPLSISSDMITAKTQKRISNSSAPSHEKSTEKVNEQNSDQNKITDVDDTSSVLLNSFSEKNPKLEPKLRATRNYYQALKESFNSGALMTKAAFEQVEGLFDLYAENVKSTKSVLADFAVALGIPKLAYDIIVDRRTDCPELTTWDREVEIEKGAEGEESETGNAKNQKTKDDEEKISTLKQLQDVICLLFGALLNYSDLHDQFCLACNEAGMVQIFVEITKELQDSIPHNVKFVDRQTQRLTNFTVRGKMLSRTLGTLHNLSRRGATRTNFTACQAVNTVLIPLFQAEITFYSAKSLLVLANLIDEENNHLIMADEGPIKFLMRLLRKAISTKGADRHRYLGFAARELAGGLTKIAVNDNNKKTIVKCGAIPILVQMLQDAKDDQEKINACNLLWTLAFDEDNKKEIKKDESAIPELKKLLTSKNSEVKRAAAGALWECEGKEKHAEEKQQSVKAQQATETKHVMISYQWDVQKLVIQLKNKLQADGYKVWMDIDEMGGSTLESMAKAVENASVVLVCVSQKYKESPNCRSEAEYTYQLHKDIIPLMMESKYRPDGWLGFIVGSKFWIDLSEKHKLDMNANKLVKELGSRGKITVQETTVQVEDAVAAPRQSSIRSWTHSGVKRWLKDAGLEDKLDPKAAQRLDGSMLLRLQDLRQESPEFFYSSLRTDFGLNNVFNVLEFTDALEKLVG